MHRFTTLSLVVTLVIGILASVAAGKPSFDPGVPVVFEVSPQPQRGQTVQCRVQLSDVTSCDTEVYIGSSNYSLLSGMPSTVTVPSGDDEVTFYVTISSTEAGMFNLSASANGGYKTTPTFFIP